MRKAPDSRNREIRNKGTCSDATGSRQRTKFHLEEMEKVNRGILCRRRKRTKQQPEHLYQQKGQKMKILGIMNLYRLLKSTNWRTQSTSASKILTLTIRAITNEEVISRYYVFLFVFSKLSHQNIQTSSFVLAHTTIVVQLFQVLREREHTNHPKF